MPEDDSINTKPKNMYAAICIVQAICIVIILIAILIIKFFFSDGFKIFTKWYTENILEETVVTAEFSEE